MGGGAVISSISQSPADPVSPMTSEHDDDEDEDSVEQILKQYRRQDRHSVPSYLSNEHLEAEWAILMVSFPDSLHILEQLCVRCKALLEKKTSFWIPIKGDKKRLMFNLSELQGTKCAEETEAMVLTEKLTKLLDRFHTRVFERMGITGDLELKSYYTFVAAAPGYSREDLECQQFHKV